MGPPVFTQAEANGLVAVRKVAPYEAQIYQVTTFQLAGTKVSEFQARAELPFEGTELKVQVASNPSAFAFSVSLLARVPGRRQEGLCRYDVHDNPHPHRSSRCLGPPVIGPGEFHVHLYNEAVVRDGFEWHHCAEPLYVAEAPFALQVRDLIGAFVRGTNLHFSDTGTFGGLFDLGRS